VTSVPALLERIQADLLADATARRDSHTTDVTTVAEATEAAADGFARLPWRVLAAADGEAALRAQGITVRCLRQPDGSLPDSEDEDDTLALVARAY